VKLLLAPPIAAALLAGVKIILCDLVFGNSENRFKHFNGIRIHKKSEAKVVLLYCPVTIEEVSQDISEKL